MSYRVPEPCLCGDPECRRCFPGASSMSGAYGDEESELAQEVHQAQLEAEVDHVMDEIDAGEHDADLLDSPLIDGYYVMKIARERAMNLRRTFAHECDIGAVNALKYQIEEYAKDTAERRLTR